MTSFETLICESADQVLHVTINRPDKLNALNSRVIAELAEVLSEAGKPGGPRCAILSGAGEKAFVAGADISEMSGLSVADAKAFSDAGHALGNLMEQAPFPIIAAVNGFALGGGCELALCCDFIYASDKARFGQPEVNLGLMPGFGGTQRLARRVGVGRARELVYTGDMIDAQRAYAIGLVNAVLPAAELLGKVKDVAKKIAAKAPLAIKSCKRVMLRGYDADLATANELEASAFGALFGSEDMREGTQAFLAKKQPVFNGR